MGKGLLPLGMQKTWSGGRNLERVSRELLFGTRLQVFGWIRFRLVVKERLWCRDLKNAREHLGFVYKLWRWVKETTEESKPLSYNCIQFILSV